jgi:LacI family transcriptional regulator
LCAVTECLIGSGRQNIAVLAGPQQHSDTVARLDGYRDAPHAHELHIDSALCVVGGFTFASGLAAAERLLDLSTRPDSIVAGNDDMAAAIVWVARERGINLPKDLSVTGIDDTMIATRVPLTTDRQPIRDMAAEAMEWLARAVRNSEQNSSPTDIVLHWPSRDETPSDQKSGL